MLSLMYMSSPMHICGVGVRNITALGNLISWQKVDYDFNYHQMEFPCNINVLIMSEGRSLLPVRTAGCTSFSPSCTVRLLQTLEGQQGGECFYFLVRKRWVVVLSQETDLHCWMFPWAAVETG